MPFLRFFSLPNYFFVVVVVVVVPFVSSRPFLRLLLLFPRFLHSRSFPHGLSPWMTVSPRSPPSPFPRPPSSRNTGPPVVIVVLARRLRASASSRALRSPPRRDERDDFCSTMTMTSTRIEVASISPPTSSRTSSRYDAASPNRPTRNNIIIVIVSLLLAQK